MNEEAGRTLRAVVSWSGGKDSAAALGAVAFGDIFLADVRAYREVLLARCGLRGLFPLRPGASRRDFAHFLAFATFFPLA